jgi:uncharacterized protein (TIGR02757 family)
MTNITNCISNEELKNLLDEKSDFYNRTEFIGTDPVQIPHLFSEKEDIEISGFLAATIAWGQRISIINNARKMLRLMDDAPADFVKNHTESDLQKLIQFKHRTFKGDDFMFFVQSLQCIYKNYGSLENIFTSAFRQKNDIKDSIVLFRKIFFEPTHLIRTEKHVANILKGSTAKRLNLFLRWMVRNDTRGVDFGLWKNIPPSALFLPLDIHSGNVARKLQLLSRKSNDWKAVEELTEKLRIFDSQDPVKYDYALFGLGIFEKF